MDGELFDCNGKVYSTASLPKWARELIASLARQRTALHKTIERYEEKNRQSREEVYEARNDLGHANDRADALEAMIQTALAQWQSYCAINEPMPGDLENALQELQEAFYEYDPDNVL